MTVRVVSLGDSFSCGAGVGVHVPLRCTWVGVLADALSGGRLQPLATPGAVVADVRVAQLPLALAAGPKLATLLIGLNDVIRAGFHAARVRADLRAIVGDLRVGGATVLVVQLHDATAPLPMPGSLRQAVRERVAVLNTAVDAAARQHCGVHVLDLGAVPALTGRAAWAVDRLHPSVLGHHAIALAALGVLERVGFAAVGPVVAPAHVPPVRGWNEARWLVRHGVPWFAGHGRQVALPAARMAVRCAGLGLSGG